MLEGLSGATLLYPIIGDPLAGVQSPQQLTRGFERRGHNGICVPMLVPQDDLTAVAHGLALVANIAGLLITMPHKTAAFALCATHSERAKLLGVVSVLRRNRDGSWHGDMLDGLAFVKAQIDQGAQPRDARVLLTGAGAAGSAIAAALLEAGVRELIVTDVDPSRSDDLVSLLAEHGKGRIKTGRPDPSGCDMVCNASPSGMTAGDQLPVPAAALAPSMFVGDVVAGYGVTPLLQASIAAGCKTANGVQMVAAVQEIMLDYLLDPGFG